MNDYVTFYISENDMIWYIIPQTLSENNCFVVPPNHQMINPSSAETSVFRENEVNTMAVNALAPCVTKSSATMLTHWGRVMHICVSKITIIGSDNGLSPGRRQAIIWTSVGILLIGPLGTNFSEILIKIYTFSFKKRHLKMSSGKWRAFCLGLNVLMTMEDERIVLSHLPGTFFISFLYFISFHFFIHGELLVLVQNWDMIENADIYIIYFLQQFNDW